MGGYCDTIVLISMKMVSITVEDNGRGIPVEFIKKEGVSALEVVMTKMVLEESLIKILIKFLVDSTVGW
jgi:DNA gyrase/topoisomerase IV subunit B